jgi:predicted dehydrogenase
MRDVLRIGLIGCGAMGQGHLDVWEQTPGARVTAVCDPDEARVRETAQRRGADPFTDLEAMLDSGRVDAVDICTPSGLHADQGLLAARRGVHVLCEKPLDLNIEKADRLIAECEARGLTLACIFQRRTYPGAQRVAQAAHSGEMGRILSCSAYIKWWRAQSYYGSGGWRGTWALDGGVLANQAIHAIDHLCWLAGPVAEVEYARLETAAHEIEAEDFAIAVVRFESGARGVIEATTCCFSPLCTRVEIFSARGAAAFDDANVIQFAVNGEDRLAECREESGALGGRSEPMAISMRGHAVLLADFVEAVHEGRKPLVSGREARMSVDALNKIYRKAFPNQKVGT